MPKEDFKVLVGRRQLYRRIAKNKKQFLKDVSEFANVSYNLNTLTNDVSKCTHNSELNTKENSNLDEQEKNNDYYNSIVCDGSNFSDTDSNNNTLANAASRSTDVIKTFDKETSLIDQLRFWALNSSVTQTSVSKLLHILSPYHPELPLDCRTLLKTPINMNYKTLDTGEYCHFNLADGISHFFNNFHFSELPPDTSILYLSFNVDGMPLHSSNNSQMWPILCQIKNKLGSNCQNRPFVVGIFYGTAKPSPLKIYLENLISDLTQLITSGFCYKGSNYVIKIHSFTCDSPARSYLKCVKSHGGYSSCEKCTETGIRVDGRVVMKSTNAPKRTDRSFLEQSDEEHHLHTSPLVQLPIGLVSCFPLEYMHSLCLGVVRKLLNSWVCGPLQVRLGSRVVKLISEALVSFKNHIPKEFNRKPRSLSELARWKATEFRTFLLYVGPVVLKNYIDIAIYEHFLILHCGITILISSKHIAKFGVDYAGKLLNTFVQHCENIYGLNYLIHNIHSLCHLSDDVEIFGPLDNVSAFPFESYLGYLKRFIKSTHNPLREIYNRLKEREFIDSESLKKKIGPTLMHHLGPLPSDTNITVINQFKTITLAQVVFSVYHYSKADCYCFIQDSVVEIHNIIEIINNKFMIIGRKFNSRSALYNYPINSKELRIYVVSRLSEHCDTWFLDDIQYKCVVVPYTSDDIRKCYVSLPIVHSI